MIKFTYKSNGHVLTAYFEDMLQLIKFVAVNRIRDDDFVSINFGGDDDIDITGLEGLTAYTIRFIEEAEQRASMMYEYDLEDWF